ncbi:Glycine/D-amino acid oxidase [Aureimonas altamirensis DSM 21988]|uniref:Glycine/D-amino acid oxidase n=2 Tax=Aureimonas altamirensis TaxID=370622 RepID=A0ABF7PM81_9HYPH|nr:FAD-binding oxidoreductase [Aureimonas altamirensis]BAT25462.1 putative secreted oxidoreductase [Aureimonas altamirensis]SHK01660.1 Glycine/D-amino acid oxidase [Aureimonas altamirensis DSM 21988]
MKAIVVGAGVIGSSVAYRLAQGGAQVTLVEADRVGGGTSCVSYAWVNACEKLTSHSYYKLNYAGRQAHEAILDEFESPAWYHRPGVLQWQHAEAEAGGRDDNDPLDKYRQLVEWGYPAELIDARDVRELEPQINADAIGNAPVIHYPQDGWLDPTLYAGSLTEAAMVRHGLTLVRGKVAGLVVESGRCTGVRLDDGSVLGADAVINCSGRWSNETVGEGAPHVPLAPTVGLIAYTAPAGIGLRRALRTPLVNMRPDGAGRLLLRSNELDQLVGNHDAPALDHPQALELLRRAEATVPALASVGIEAVRIAIRPIPQDSYSAVGPVPNLGNYWVAVTHSGVTLGAFIGEALADEVLNGRPRPELDDFRPARFFQKEPA